VNPHKADTIDSLARYYAKRGDSTQALQFIRRARAIDPNSNQLVYDEAIVQTLGSHPEEALRLLGKHSKRARARLRRLLASGKSQAECASILGVSVHTVGRAVARMKRGENERHLRGSIWFWL